MLWATEPPFALRRVSRAFTLPLGRAAELLGDGSHLETQFITGLELVHNGSLLRLDYGIADCLPLSLHLPLQAALHLLGAPLAGEAQPPGGAATDTQTGSMKAAPPPVASRGRAFMDYHAIRSDL